MLETCFHPITPTPDLMMLWSCRLREDLLDDLTTNFKGSCLFPTKPFPELLMS